MVKGDATPSRDGALYRLARANTRIQYVSPEEKSTTLSQWRKQSSHSPVSLGAVPRELVRDKGGNKSRPTMPFLARFPAPSVFATYNNALAADHEDSPFLAVCIST